MELGLGERAAVGAPIVGAVSRDELVAALGDAYQDDPAHAAEWLRFLGRCPPSVFRRMPA